MRVLLRAAMYPLCWAPLLVSMPLFDTRAAPADASAWVEGSHSRARLVAGEVEGQGAARALLAGIQLKLDKGWKTYWRNPGDSGIPPQFDWSGSKNIEAVEILWPAPRRFTDPYGTSIGYKDEVVFPVRIELAQAEEPLDLRLKLAYAICKDVCIPAEADLKLEVAARGESARAFQDLIDSYLRIVPGRAPSGSAGSPLVRHVAARLVKPSPRLLIDAEFPRGTKGADLFVEAPEDFYVPLPRKVQGDDRTVRFEVDLSQGDDPERLKGKTLKLTLVSDGARAETTWQVE